MIQIEKLYQQFGTKIALDDVNINTINGGIIGLIGPNGSGKSTIIRTIMGILKPTKGTVTVDDEPVSRKISRKIAYMADINELYLPILKDNIDYYTKLYGDYDLETLNNIIASLKIDLKTPAKGLSKGQVTIIRFALTVARRVKYYIFDEPLSGLDPVFRDSFIKRLKDFRDVNSDITIIITSHMLNEIQGLLDEVIAIYFAKILAHDKKESILQNNESLETWFKEQYVKAGINF